MAHSYISLTPRIVIIKCIPVTNRIGKMYNQMYTLSSQGHSCVLSVELFENCNGKTSGKFANSAVLMLPVRRKRNHGSSMLVSLSCIRIIEVIVEYIETLQYPT